MRQHIKAMHSSKKRQEKNDTQPSNRRKNKVQEAHSSRSIRENIEQEQNNRMTPNINENVVQEQNNHMTPADQSIGQANMNENNEKNKITKGRDDAAIRPY